MDKEAIIENMIKIFGSAKVKTFCQLTAFGIRMEAEDEEDIKKAMWYENKLTEIL